MSEEKEEGFVAKTYRQMLEMGEKAVEAVQIPFKVRAAKNDLNGEIIKLEGEIADEELAIVQAKSKHPMALKTILNAIDDKELKERQLKQAEELMEELFPNK